LQWRAVALPALHRDDQPVHVQLLQPCIAILYMQRE
jgi:hypothetical protein